MSSQQFGKILDVEIIFNERGSKVSAHQATILDTVTGLLLNDFLCSCDYLSCGISSPREKSLFQN